MLQSILIVSDKKEIRAGNDLLGALALVFSLVLFDYLGFFTLAHLRFPHGAYSYAWLTALVGPLFYGYFRTVSDARLPRRVFLWHLLPALLVGGLQLPFYALAASVKVAILSGELDFPAPFGLDGTTWFQWISALTGIQLLVYCLASFRLVHRAQPGISTRFLRTIFWLFGGFVLSYWFYLFLVRTPYYSLLFDYSICLAMAVFIYSLAFLAYRRPQIWEAQHLGAAFQPKKYGQNALTPASIASLKRRLEAHMDQEQPHLDSDLRLPKLAAALGVSTHQLSQVINTEYGQSFSQFINSYRIDEAEQLLRNSDRQVIEIAYQVGFNNKTSFYKAFKKQLAVSPTEYRKQFPRSKEQPKKIRQSL